MIHSGPAARYDCVIVGGGAAGLSAALLLGRCRRRVAVCDSGRPRNARARAIHGYLTRDGMPPGEFLETARGELVRYDSVELRQVEVTDAVREGDGFRVTCRDGTVLAGRKLLLASGVVDELPPVEGLAPLYGTSVHHCPYCDAWEWRDQPLAVYGKGEAASALAIGLSVWSADVVLCSDGAAELTESARDGLAQQSIPVREDPVVRLEGEGGRLRRVVFEDGTALERSALFFAGGQRQCSPLAERLGCRFNDNGTVETGSYESTNVPGLYVAGDASEDVQFVVVAAAEGVQAAVAINKALLKEDLLRKSARSQAGPGAAAHRRTAAE